MIERAWKTLSTMMIAAYALALTEWPDPPPRFVWNATPSARVGLYAVREADKLAVGDLVVVRPPKPLADWLAEGGYLPTGVPLMKRVAALPKQIVCRDSTGIVVDGIATAAARERDRLGRPLPLWLGCRTIGTGELFLMNRNEPDSLDGRYFGPTPSSAVLGRAHALWTRDGT